MTDLKIRPVVVRWQDAEHPSEGTWTTKSELVREPDLNVATCGYLVHMDEHIVMVAVSLTGHNKEAEQYTGIMTIPRRCIDSIYEMEETKKKVR